MTQTNIERPKGLSRLDPVLRDTAAELGILEFRAETLPAERERANRVAAELAAGANTDGVRIESRSIAGPGGGRPELRLHLAPTQPTRPALLYPPPAPLPPPTPPHTPP